jgi:hypothetical protein
LGQFTRTFYHFRSLLADREAEARLAWLVAQAIRGVEMATGVSADCIVTVTRPSEELALAAIEIFSVAFHRQIKVITGDSPELLANRFGTLAAEHAIYLTAVLSTGTTSSRVLRGLPFVNAWMGTVTCLDTRADSDILAKVQLAPGADLEIRSDCPTGEVYALAHRQLEREDFEIARRSRVVAIDPINVCPVGVPDSRLLASSSPESDLWRYVREGSQTLKAGHFEESDGHHYVYIIDTAALLHTAPADSPDTVKDQMIECVISDLDERDPDRIIILHPPAPVSAGASLAREFRRRTGAKYREILYRDEFAGRSRFNPLGELSLPWRGSTVVIFDDASNTGEALMGLLDTAARNRPRRIFAWVALNRLPVHRSNLLAAVSSLVTCHNVSVRFYLSLDVPVFTSRTCPVCRLGHKLTAARAAAPFLHSAIDRLRTALAPRRLERAGDPTIPYPLALLNAARVARLREAIERSDFEPSAREFLEDSLAAAAQRWEHVADLAFILGNEPELVNAPILTAHLLSLLSACEDAISECSAESIAAVLTLGTVLTTRLIQMFGDEAVAELAGC